jgi:hypothetical protein
MFVADLKRIRRHALELSYLAPIDAVNEGR